MLFIFMSSRLTVRFELRTHFRRTRLIFTANPWSSLIDRAARMISFPGKKRTAAQVMSILCRNEVIAHPDGVFPLNHIQDILPALVAPALLILR